MFVYLLHVQHELNGCDVLGGNEGCNDILL